LTAVSRRAVTLSKHSHQWSSMPRTRFGYASWRWLAVGPPDGVSHSRQRDPIVIGHRSASGCRPKHTLASYALTIELGADHVEPDQVPTADGLRLARHGNEFSGTTNVAERPEFADRCTTKVVAGGGDQRLVPPSAAAWELGARCSADSRSVLIGSAGSRSTALPYRRPSGRTANR